MEMLVTHRGKPHASHHSFPFFPLPYPTLTSVSNPSNWTFNDDIDRVSNDKAALAHSREVGGAGGGGGGGGPSGVELSGEDGSDIPNSSSAVPLEEEEHTPPLTQSRTVAGSLGFDATYFYQYMDDHFPALTCSMRLMSGNSSMLKISVSCFADRWNLIAGNAIWSIMFISHTNTMVGPTLLSIRGLMAPWPLLMLYKSPLPLFSSLHASSCCIGDSATFKHWWVT